jgi:phenylacetaldehyde dehydrogenase
MDATMDLLANDFTRLSASTRRTLDRGGRLLIGGEWAASASGSSLDVVDPSSGNPVSSLAAGGAADIDAAVAAAKAAFQGKAWGGLAPSERERLLLRLADLLEHNATGVTELESVDVGMPIWMARKLDLGGTLAAIRYMAGWPTKIAGRTATVGVPIPDSAFFGYTVREPVGVVGAIIPWNVPLMLAAWKLAPVLAADCTLVLKPSEEASLSVLALGRLIEEAGFPPGVVNIVTGGAEAGMALVRHPDVAKITFTGSTVTGQAIARIAAETTKKLTLELGGKSPQLLFADADLDRAIPGIAVAIFLNSGQVCVAGSRLYLDRRIHAEAVERLERHIGALRIGPGLADDTVIGPLVSRRQQDRVQGFISEAAAEGVSVLTGRATLPDAGGFYVAPTLVADARQDMRIVREEVFGPVLTVIPFDDFDEALSLANDTPYGLSACVWTESLPTALAAVEGLKTGKVAVNSDPMPYPAPPEGGRKASGYGRDLGEEAVASFLETKSVLMRWR